MIFSGDDKTRASLKDFTGSFDAGKGTDIAASLVNDGAQMILPVAGPQTGDVAGIIASTGNKGKVFSFGVDVDQSKVYNPDYFLGSAIKGLYVSDAFALSELAESTKTHTVHKSFPQFNMALSNPKLSKNTEFITFTKKLRAKLEATNKYSKEEIDVMLKPTGFAPSSIMKKLTIGTQGTKTIYDHAKEFVESGKVQAAL